MKTIIYNYDNLKEKDITDRVIRVKAVIINKNNEILLGEAFGTMQFPGGHLKNNENMLDALKREILEETGIKLNGEYNCFLVIKYFLKDYPSKGSNQSMEIYYFKVETNKKYVLKNMKLDKQEKAGKFELVYVPLKNIKRVLKETKKVAPINKIVVREMLLALKYLK